jgi:uncharacterized coiled-coil protein SlyX
MKEQTERLERRIEELEHQLAKVEGIIAQLRNSLILDGNSGATVRAPLRVVDEEGNRLLEVSSQREKPFLNELCLFNRQGQKVACLGAEFSGGFLAIRNDEGKLLGYLTCENEGARLDILSNESDDGVTVFGREAGGGINITSETSVIGLWTTSEGSEIEIWHDHPQRKIVSLFVSSKDDRVNIRTGERDISLD